MTPPRTAFDKSGRNVPQALVDQLMVRISRHKPPEQTVLIPQQLIMRPSCQNITEKI